jgi:hypothetical protein
MGQAPQRYDDFQKDRLLMQIERIKKNNAELCQTHYTATKFKKGGPGVKWSFRYNLRAPFVQQDPLTFN